MYDLQSLSLNALIHVARRANLIDDCRMTDWVVVLRIEEEDLVLNHASAHVFLQGLIHGIIRLQKLVGGEVEQNSPRLRTSEGVRAIHRTLIDG